MIVRVFTIEASVLLISGVFLTPVALSQALQGAWAGLAVYARLAAWGGVFLIVCLILANVAGA